MLSPRGPVRHGQLVDLSSRGARLRALETARPKDELFVTFRAPGLATEVGALARVARVESNGVALPDLGIEFVDLEHAVSHDLDRALRGLPPPMPSSARPIEIAWADMTVSWEEELDDSTLFYETSERVTLVDDGESLHEVTLAGPAVAWPLHLRRR